MRRDIGHAHGLCGVSTGRRILLVLTIRCQAFGSVGEIFGYCSRHPQSNYAALRGSYKIFSVCHLAVTSRRFYASRVSYISTVTPVPTKLAKSAACACSKAPAPKSSNHRHRPSCGKCKSGCSPTAGKAKLGIKQNRSNDQDSLPGRCVPRLTRRLLARRSFAYQAAMTPGTPRS